MAGRTAFFAICSLISFASRVFEKIRKIKNRRENRHRCVHWCLCSSCLVLSVCVCFREFLRCFPPDRWLNWQYLFSPVGFVQARRTSSIWARQDTILPSVAGSIPTGKRAWRPVNFWFLLTQVGGDWPEKPELVFPRLLLSEQCMKHGVKNRKDIACKSVLLFLCRNTE